MWWKIQLKKPPKTIKDCKKKRWSADQVFVHRNQKKSIRVNSSATFSNIFKTFQAIWTWKDFLLIVFMCTVLSAYCMLELSINCEIWMVDWLHEVENTRFHLFPGNVDLSINQDSFGILLETIWSPFLEKLELH